MSEANRDEALKCFHISRQHWASGQRGLAHKYALKSVSLYETADGRAWLEKIQVEYNGEGVDEEPAPPKPTKSPASEEVKKQETASNASTASFTAEQLAQVKKFDKINKNDYYAVLGVPKDASDADIKKAYRKLALQFHPDKNRAPGADEVFKAISRAFTVLGDSNERAHFDRFGAAAPTGQGGSPFAGAGGFPGAGGIDPEDLFRAFFGGGGSPFGGNGAFHFHMGGGHPFFASGFGQPHPGMRRRRPQQHQAHHEHEQQNQRGPASDFDRLRQTVRQLLPIILFFIFSLLTSWWSSGDTTPAFSSFDEIADFVSLQPGLGFPYSRTTYKFKVPYYATSQFQAHFKEYDQAMDKKKRPPTRLQRELVKYEETLERYFVKDLQRQCKAETNELNQRMKEASKDAAELKRLRNQTKPSCAKLHSLGVK